MKQDPSGLLLKTDPVALAPERLLVFEVRASIQTFAAAVKRVPGLELVDEDELIGDANDKQPTAYLLIPNLVALREIESLWKRWLAGESLGWGFAPWRDVFATLRDLRPWGARDRVSDLDQALLEEELRDRDDLERVRLEVELVFRGSEDRGALVETEIAAFVARRGGRLISRCRISEIGYHAVLAEFSAEEAREIVARSEASIAAIDLVMHIRPQAVASSIDVAEIGPGTDGQAVGEVRPAIVGLLDGVPVASHPLLLGRIAVDDQFGLEAEALVAARIHGTAMASLISFGDRNIEQAPVGRAIHCVPVLGNGDQFPADRLIVDMIFQAVTRMRGDVDPTAPGVVIVNLSLGNERQRFYGKLSSWARLIDRLSYKYGILFLISAGNHLGPFEVPGFATATELQDATARARAEALIRAVGAVRADRRLLSPAEAVNAITVGSANIDSVAPIDRTRAGLAVDPYGEIVVANPSSALGPGFANSTKPDLLMPGGKEHLTPVVSGGALRVRPSPAMRARGLKVAAPPRGGIENAEGYSGGTSAAAALASRTCHLVYDALEHAYGQQFLALSHAQKAVLLKALLVHTAAWPEETHEIIKSVLGPADNKQNVQQRDNVRRFMGYGVSYPDVVMGCTEDRATLWVAAEIGREAGLPIAVPIPRCVHALARPHAVVATLAWLTPTLPGRQSYRATRLSLLEAEELESALRVDGAKLQPDFNQSRRGTVFSRRWESTRAPNVSNAQVLNFVVQREPDQGSGVDETVPFGLAISFAMPGVNQVYDEIRARIPAPVVVR